MAGRRLVEAAVIAERAGLTGLRVDPVASHFLDQSLHVVPVGARLHIVDLGGP
jgi:hypothetical protein